MTPQKEKQALLSTDKLSIGYRTRSVASAISINIYPGEFTAIIGVNGSGKSTLIKALTGEIPQQSGKITLYNKPFVNYTPKEISEYISIVLPHPKFHQNLKVREVIAIGRHPYTNWLGKLTKKDRSAINRALHRVGITDLAERNCHELSDGQLQKVFIARSLAQDTEIIILDEPTNHLDIYHKAFVFKLLKNLSQSMDKAIVFATHEINLAIELCDNIILIDHKNIMQDTPDQLLKKGAFQKLFPQDLIKFDSDVQRFKLRSSE